MRPAATCRRPERLGNDRARSYVTLDPRLAIGRLTNRDGIASPMREDCDFSHAAFATPPTLPAAPLDPVQFAACMTAPPPGGF